MAKQQQRKALRTRRSATDLREWARDRCGVDQLQVIRDFGAILSDVPKARNHRKNVEVEINASSAF